jgi:hypothetical protein
MSSAEEVSQWTTSLERLARMMITKPVLDGGFYLAQE